MSGHPRWLANHLAKQTALVQARREAGLCLTCGDPAGGRARCAVCRFKDAVSKRRRKAAQA